MGSTFDRWRVRLNRCRILKHLPGLETGKLSTSLTRSRWLVPPNLCRSDRQATHYIVRGVFERKEEFQWFALWLRNGRTPARSLHRASCPPRLPPHQGTERFGVLLKELGIKRSLRNHENRELPFKLRNLFAIRHRMLSCKRRLLRMPTLPWWQVFQGPTLQELIRTVSRHGERSDS